MVSLHPSRPPLATIGRALTLIQVIFYLPLTLDVGGSDAFLALSAALASYYWALSSLRLATRKTPLKWLGDLFATFQFLVIPACLAICWAVYCPPEKNYFFVRWARTAAGGTGAAGLIGRLPGAGSQTSHILSSSPSSSHLLSSSSSSQPGAHPATPPHLAAILQAISPLLKGTNSHPYLEGLFDICSEAILYLARKVPGWWGTFLRLSSPAFSLLEGSATLLVIQVLGTGCRYIIATSLTSGVRSAPPEAAGATSERKARRDSQGDEDVPNGEDVDGNVPSGKASRRRRASENGHSTPNGASGGSGATARRGGRIRRLAFAPFKLLSSIGIRGAEAWQLFFLLSSAIIYVVSGWALFLAFDGVAARGGAAALMMGVSVASVAWLTAIAFAIGKGNVVETALIFAYTSWNIFALSSASSLSFVSDPLALVRSFKGQVTSSYLDRLAPHLAAALPDALQSFVAESIELVKVTFGQSWTFLGALASALPASVVVSLVYRLMVLYAASRILPFLCGPSARRRQEQWPPRHRRSSRQSKHRSGQHSSSHSGYSSSATSSAPTTSYSGSSGSSSSGASSDGDYAERTGASPKNDGTSKTASRSDASGVNGQDAPSTQQQHRRSSSSASSSSSSSSSAFSSSSASTSDIEDLSPSESSAPETDTDAESEPEPFGSFISFIVSYARLILIAVYSHLLLLDQSHQAMWRFSTVSVTLGLWTMELLLGNQGDEIVEFASAWQQQQQREKQQRYRQRSRHGHGHGHERYRRNGSGSGAGAPRRTKAR